MSYKVFHSVMLPRKEPEPTGLEPADFPTKELALAGAFALIEQKRIVWRVEGPDGYKVARRDMDVIYNDKMGKWPAR